MSVLLKENAAIAVKELEAQKELIKRMYCKGCTDDEAAVFFEVCKRTGLNPIQRHIYPIKYGNQMNIITGIDGLRLIAERTGKYSPGKAADFSYDENGRLVSATAYIKKLTDDGTWHEVSHVAYMEEYNPGKGMWAKMPRVMLSKCAEAQALRKAFPGDLSGLYAQEEMDQADERPSHSLDYEKLKKEIDSYLPLLSDEEIEKSLKFCGAENFEEIKPQDYEPLLKSMRKKYGRPNGSQGVA